MDDTEFPAPVWDAAPRRVRYGAQAARTILARTAAGESMRAICRDPGMPAPHTVGRWAKDRPTFAEALLAARQAAGGPFRGGRSTYCEATAQAIFERVCAGEALTAVCRDADMPVAATVYKWRAERPEFARALAMAMAIRADGLFEHGWDLAQAATPQTAYLTHVRLGQLRWHVGKLAPKKYGAIKPVEAGGGAGPPALHVYTKRFVLPTAEEEAQGQRGRWSEAPAEHLYSMVQVGKHARSGERLPPPDVVREPASTQGPDARGEARGGAVEAELDDPGEGWAAEPDDYWL